MTIEQVQAVLGLCEAVAVVCAVGLLAGGLAWAIARTFTDTYRKGK